MSTVDPTSTRRASFERSRRTRGLILAGYVIGVPLTALGGVMFASIVETLRSSLLLTTGASAAMFDHLWLAPVSIVGSVAGVMVLGATAGLARKADGRVLGSMLPAVLGSCAATLGSLLAVTQWHQPESPGQTEKPWETTTWGFGSWFLYYSTWWLPGIFTLITVFLLLSWVRTERRNARLTQTRDRLLAAGRRVTGVVSDVRLHYSSDDNGSKRLAGATGVVRYVDAHGTTRWVTRRTSDAGRVGLGLGASVLFDPLAPEDLERIFVAFEPDPLPHDWIPNR